MKPVKILGLLLILLALIAAAPAVHFNYRNEPGSAIPAATYARLKKYSGELASFIRAYKYNEQVCFLVDMKIPSGQNRFFVYNLEADSVLFGGLVTNGRCDQVAWLKGRKYSNIKGSACTSLGRYRIGKSYNGEFGLAYKLHGMDASNYNAYSRFVVLHAHDCVPDKEIAPQPLCQSEGCPTVSPSFLKKLDAILRNSERPVMLHIFE